MRIGLQRGNLPFGTAVKANKRWNYYISPKLFYEYVGEQEAIDLMEYVDEINCKMGGEKTRLYANSDAAIAKK